MKQVVDYLRRVDTWTALAIVALLGWLLDSLFWYLETHPLTLAGFITYLAHSWYALPLLAAIFVILRLRRPSELLSLTIYDERGVPIHHQGNFRLEETILESIIVSFRGATQERGLHHIKLPTGPVIYFLRQGALTLVACFSGPPRRAQLDGAYVSWSSMIHSPKICCATCPPTWLRWQLICSMRRSSATCWFTCGTTPAWR